MPRRKKLIGKGLPFVQGSWLTFADPAVAEIMVSAGFDFLVVDMEHTMLTLESAAHIIRCIDLAGATSLVRLPSHDPSLVKRVMDFGAQGVIVPMVNSPAEAEQAVKAVRYPPKGQRGVGLSRAQGYGTEFDLYREWLLTESTVVVQIEHKDAINHLDSILAVPGVDGFMVGLYDMSASYGKPGELDCPEIQKALERITDAVTKHAAGVHLVQPDLEKALKMKKSGYQFIAFSTDFLLLGKMARESAGKLKD